MLVLMVDVYLCADIQLTWDNIDQPKVTLKELLTPRRHVTFSVYCQRLLFLTLSLAKFHTPECFQLWLLGNLTDHNSLELCIARSCNPWDPALAFAQEQAWQRVDTNKHFPHAEVLVASGEESRGETWREHRQGSGTPLHPHNTI